MRLPRFTLVCIVLPVLTAAGCGGSTVQVEQVPGPPVNVVLPGNADALQSPAAGTQAAGGAAAQGTGSTATGQGTAAAGATATPSPTATPTAGTGAATGSGQTGGAAGGQNTAQANQPPPAGSDAQKFEDFCAQNPGAC